MTIAIVSRIFRRRRTPRGPRPPRRLRNGNVCAPAISSMNRSYSSQLIAPRNDSSQDGRSEHHVYPGSSKDAEQRIALPKVHAHGDRQSDCHRSDRACGKSPCSAGKGGSQHEHDTNGHCLTDVVQSELLRRGASMTNGRPRSAHVTAAVTRIAARIAQVSRASCLPGFFRHFLLPSRRVCVRRNR